jgi:hypothetical protein
MNPTRRRFLQAMAGATGLTMVRARGEASAKLKATTCNPLLRTPLALIIDDACPVINKAWVPGGATSLAVTLP